MSTHLEGSGEFDFNIVGESFYQSALSDICGGKTEDGHEYYCLAFMVPEPNNRYDRNAVAVYIDNLKVGHFDKHTAKTISRKMRGEIFSADAVIVGGWKGSVGGNEGSFGVKLDL